MKKDICSFLLCFSVLATGAFAQTNRWSANVPADTYKPTGLAKRASVYGVFVGRTPCREFMAELNLGVRVECTKRKMSVILYQDSVTHEPTFYETKGMAKWSGKGKWHILRGTPTDAGATVFQLDLDADTFLFLLKGDDNVLFILDTKKNFLVGNADHSYTMNRAAN